MDQDKPSTRAEEREREVGKILPPPSYEPLYARMKTQKEKRSGWAGRGAKDRQMMWAPRC